MSHIETLERMRRLSQAQLAARSQHGFETGGRDEERDAIAAAIEALRDLPLLRQAVWDARAILGFDNDGQATPDAMTEPTLAELVLCDAREMREAYDEGQRETAELAREVEGLRVDAERYRWLRDRTAASHVGDEDYPSIVIGEHYDSRPLFELEADAAIDRARGAK